MSALVDWIRAHPDLLARTAAEHVILSSTAIALAALIGVALGVALARRPAAAGPALAVVTSLRAVPSLALLVLLLPVLGAGTAPSVVALTLYGLPAVLLNTVAGLGGVDRDVVEAARGQGFTDRQVLARVELPLAGPTLAAGIRTAAVQIVSAATLAVFVGGGGLGELISAGMGLLDIPQLVIGSLAVAALAAAAEGLGAVAERALSRRVGVAS